MVWGPLHNGYKLRTWQWLPPGLKPGIERGWFHPASCFKTGQDKQFWKCPVDQLPERARKAIELVLDHWADIQLRKARKAVTSVPAGREPVQESSSAASSSVIPRPDLIYIYIYR